MSCPALFSIARRGAALVAQRSSSATTSTAAARLFATDSSGLPESATRVGAASAFPNEYPGQIYAFNWSLNADGVTPLKKSAFRITKPLDLKVAGLKQPKTSPLKVEAAAERALMPEAGSDELAFDAFDEVTQRTKDLLSLSDHLYCPEGHIPGTRTGVRVISNSAALAPDLVAYLERMPKREPKSQPVTAYVLESEEVDEFAGYAIEEVEQMKEGGAREAASVATVVVVGKKPTIERIAAGLKLSIEGLAADEAERAEKKATEAQEAAE